MNLERTSHWLALLGNTGLLIGMALVIFQINQNSELVREQLEHAMWTDRLNLHLAMMGENPAAAVATAIENPSALTLEETRVLDAYFQYWTLFEVRNIVMHEREMTVSPAKTYTSEDPGYILDVRTLGNRYIKAKFEESGFGPDLSPRIQALMGALSGTETLDEYNRVIGRIKVSQ